MSFTSTRRGGRDMRLCRTASWSFRSAPCACFLLPVMIEVPSRLACTARGATAPHGLHPCQIRLPARLRVLQFEFFANLLVGTTTDGYRVASIHPALASAWSRCLLEHLVPRVSRPTRAASRPPIGAMPLLERRFVAGPPVGECRMRRRKNADPRPHPGRARDPEIRVR